MKLKTKANFIEGMLGFGLFEALTFLLLKSYPVDPLPIVALTVGTYIAGLFVFRSPVFDLLQWLQNRAIEKTPMPITHVVYLTHYLNKAEDSTDVLKLLHAYDLHLYSDRLTRAHTRLHAMHALNDLEKLISCH